MTSSSLYPIKYLSEFFVPYLFSVPYFLCLQCILKLKYDAEFNSVHFFCFFFWSKNQNCQFEEFEDAEFNGGVHLF